MLPQAIGVTKNPEVAEELAACLQLLYHADGNVQLRNRLTLPGSTPVIVEWHDATAAVPAWALAIHDEWTLVLVAGCGNLDHAASTATGYMPVRTTFNPGERFEHRYFTALAGGIYARLRGEPRLMNQPVRLAGHSLGGCVVQSLGWLLNVGRDVTNNVHICTFGSPKWGWRWQQDQLARIPVARWMNSDDPVPLVYPTVNDFLPFLLQYTVTQAITVSRFTQSAGGLVIAQDGDIVAGDYPPLSAVNWSIAMGAWLWQWENEGPTNPHSLAQYRARLHLFNDRDVPPRLLPHGTERTAPTEEHNRRLVNRAEGAVAAQVRAVEAEQRERPIRIPRERLVRVQHRGNVHVLVWNGEAIAVVTRRTTANAVARNCNNFLESLLHAGLVQPETIQTQLGAFLSAAGNTDSGIQPLIVSTLPAAP